MLTDFVLTARILNNIVFVLSCISRYHPITIISLSHYMHDIDIKCFVLMSFFDSTNYSLTQFSKLSIIFCSCWFESTCIYKYQYLSSINPLKVRYNRLLGVYLGLSRSAIVLYSSLSYCYSYS